MPNPAGSAGRNLRSGSVIAFVVVAFALSWACFLAVHALHLPFVLVDAGMFGPAIAALLVRLVGREPLRELGLWPLGRPRWYLAGYLIPPAAIVIGAALELATGYQHWDPHLQGLFPVSPSHKAEPPAAVLGVLLVVGAFTAGALERLPLTLGEELGWRGHLLPRLSPFGGATAAVLTGVIWGLWHAPVIAFYGFGGLIGLPGYGIGGWLVAPFFCLTTVPLGIVYGWLRFRSGSVWPCVLAHAMADSGLAALAVLALSTPANMLIGGPIGLLGVAALWALAIWLMVTGRLRPTGDASPPGERAAAPGEERRPRARRSA